MKSATHDAVLLDLDGVLTPTAAPHARCRKEIFDPSSADSGRRARTWPEPFDADHDDVIHVDFLRVRGIAAPEARADRPGKWSVQGRPDDFPRLIGVARSAAPAELQPAGADIVVADLVEMP